MLDLTQLNTFVKKLANIQEVAQKSADITVMEQKDELVEENRQQLLEGRKSNDDLITPSYLDDPFFKTPQAAERYARWKQRITPNPKRPYDTPNLFINGYFHSSIDMKKVDELEYFFTSNNSFGKDIINKYGNNLLGLDSENRDDLAKDITTQMQEDIYNYLKP